ncbi:MAG TPA: hypothetical protein VK187_05985, partial [Geobacteraceae bacterium]|nr:hypothetical protein [Geobacteraceae bacterium]
LAGKGVDLLGEGAADRKKLVRWLVGSGVFVALIGLFWLFLTVGVQTVISYAAEFITAPTRYQSGPQLVTERYVFMHRETGIAFGLACLYCAAFVAWYNKWLPSRALLPLLVVFLLGDLWRVNDNFFVLTTPPQANKAKAKNDVVTFLENRIDHYRLQPINDENAHYYTDYGFANVSAYVTISERRYKEYLDNFSLTSPMPDIMNLKYLIMPAGEYQSQKGALSGKYQPVFTSSGGSVVLENTTVLPKAWLVPSVAVVPDPQQQLGIMSSDPNFRPAMIALVETPPPLPMAQYGQAAGAGSARVDSYEADRIKLTATATANALLVMGEKYYAWWYATVDGKSAEIYPVDHILRGVYLTPGTHTVEFTFDPLPFKVGKWLTLASFAFFAVLLGREVWLRLGTRDSGRGTRPSV